MKGVLAAFLLFFCLIGKALTKPYPGVQWRKIAAGLELAEVYFPFRIFCGDSSVKLIRIHRDSARLQLLTAANTDKISLTAAEWAVHKNLHLVFNAGMYIPGTIRSKGQMKADGQWNQPESLPTFGGVFCLEGNRDEAFQLLDKSCKAENKDKEKYSSHFECMRLLDCHGKPLSWEKKIQYCSMLVAAEDSAGNLVLAFCRSPMRQAEMAVFLSGLPIGLRTTLYLEGGPETSVLIDIPGVVSEKWIGTFVSDTWEKTDNQEFRKLPNAVGIKLPFIRK